MKKNGWKKASFIAVTIVAFGGAAAVVMPYTYALWAPAVSFSWAAENSLNRLDNQLFTLEILEAQAIANNDGVALRSVRERLANVKRKIEEIKVEKAKHE